MKPCTLPHGIEMAGSPNNGTLTFLCQIHGSLTKQEEDEH
jgi:hypothetical protein